MCDIDRELVMRGAAIMATYAAGMEPARPTSFEARLIEQALRARVMKFGGAALAAAPSTGTLEERAVRLYRSARPSAPTPRPAMTKLVAALLAEPERSFRPMEAGEISGHKNACEALKNLMKIGLAAKGQHKGTYKLGPKGKQAA